MIVKIILKQGYKLPSEQIEKSINEDGETVYTIFHVDDVAIHD